MANIDFGGVNRLLVAHASDWLDVADSAGDPVKAYAPPALRPSGNPDEHASLALWRNGAVKDYGGDGWTGDTVRCFATIRGLGNLEAAQEALRRWGAEVSDTASLSSKREKPGPRIPIPPEAREALLQRVRSAWAHQRHGNAVAGWRYYRADGGWAFSTVRFQKDGKKEIIPYYLGADGDWHQGQPFERDRPLYGLPRVLAHPDLPVLVVEGEGCADAAQKALGDGWIVVTWAGGASAVGRTDWAALAGRAVTVWPDRDKPGRAAAARIAKRLSQTKVLDPGPGEDGWDVVDALKAGWEEERLLAFLGAAVRPVRLDNSDMSDAEKGASPTAKITAWLAGKLELDDEAVLQLLPRLDALAYERARQKIGERLRVRVGVLDSLRQPQTQHTEESAQRGQELAFPDVEPWLEPVEPAGLLNEVAAVVNKYVAAPLRCADAAALWVAFTWIHDEVEVSPLLAISSPTKRCGKTTLLSVLGQLASRPLPSSNVTPAALFRAVEKYRPTLLVDEADTFARDNPELRGILNSGHLRSQAYVARCEGDAHEVRLFSTWGPKAVALIGRLPATLTDRSIVIELQRKTADEPVQRLRLDRIGEECAPLRRKLARWAKDASGLLKGGQVPELESLHDRANDNWRPLRAIAAAAGGMWPARADQAALLLSATQNEDEPAIMLLQDLRGLFEEVNAERLSSEQIVTALKEMENRPWPEYRSGKVITPRQLAKLLAYFKITPKDIRFGAEVRKGYALCQLEEAWSRYTATPRGNCLQEKDMRCGGSVADSPDVAPLSAISGEDAT
jgi:hypothetical protein